MAQVIGADRVLPATAALSSIHGELLTYNSMEPTPANPPSALP